MEEAENFVDLAFPMAGLSLLSPHAIRTPETTPEGINVRDYDCLKLRRRGGSRPGLRRWIDQSLPLETTAFTDSDIYTILTQGLAAGSDQHLHLMFGFGAPAGDDVATGLIQMLNVLVNPAGYALIDAYIDNHRGFARIHPEEALDPIFLVPIDSFPIEDEEPWSDSNGGFEDPSNPDNFVRNGGSGAGRNSRQTPNIVWGNPSSILVGTALSATQLSAIAYDPDEDPPATPLTGTYRYRPAIETILELGEDQPLKVTFVPDDQATYRNAVKFVSIDVVDELGIEFKQKKFEGLATDPDSVTLDDAVFEDDFIIVAVAPVNAFASNPTTDSVTDSLGNTYTKIADLPHSVGALRQNLSVWTARSTSAGVCTITANFSNFDPSGAASIVAATYSGVDPSVPTDDVATATGSGDSATAGPADSSDDGRCLVAIVFGSTSGGWGANFPITDWTFRQGPESLGDESNWAVLERNPVGMGTFSVTVDGVSVAIWASVLIVLNPEA